MKRQNQCLFEYGRVALCILSNIRFWTTAILKSSELAKVIMSTSVTELPGTPVWIINTASSVLFVTTMLAVGTYHVYMTFKHNQHGLNLLKSPASIPFSFSLLFISTWFSFFLAWQMLYQNNSLSYCYFSLYMGPGSYAVFKLNLYLVLILRVHGSFKNSPLEYSVFKLKIWASILILWQTTNLFY